jgi:hypothetical protein
MRLSVDAFMVSGTAMMIGFIICHSNTPYDLIDILLGSIVSLLIMTASIIAGKAL